MPHRPTHRNPRQNRPELESDPSRRPELGYEDPRESGWVRCLAHGFPSPLARWHCHEEYELHLIVASRGKAFVGDWIGSFEPGHLVLCGPQLPHNWVSQEGDEEVLRDRVVQFTHAPLAATAQALPELTEVMRLMNESRHGVQFFGMGERAEQHWHAIHEARGAARVAAFLTLLADLAACRDTRRLSVVPIAGMAEEDEIDRISQLVGRISLNAAESLSVARCAEELGMSESRFSRFFQRCTGNSFTEFVTRVRVGNACHLLMHTDSWVTDICYQVGFNNVANFNRRFLAIKGVTPTQYRRQAAQRFEGATRRERLAP